MSEHNPDLACRRVVELTTEYLEGALVPARRAQLEQHLVVCAGCVAYIQQMRLAVRALATLSQGPVEPAARESALQAFRALRKGGSTP